MRIASKHLLALDFLVQRVLPVWTPEHAPVHCALAVMKAMTRHYLVFFDEGTILCRDGGGCSCVRCFDGTA